ANAFAREYIAEYDHWIAGGVLLAIGGKMIFDGLRAGPDELPAGTLAVYLGLAVATSIDAAAAGLSLPVLAAPPWLAVLLIGAITAACSALAFAFGRAIGGRLGHRLGIVGGLALIAIALDILIRAP